jgi:hypothetical protein
MTRPNLQDPAELAVYRRELRNLYKLWRWSGIGIVVAGVILMFARDGQFDRYSMGLLVLGWAILIGVIVQRSRYHRRRMAEPTV